MDEDEKEMLSEARARLANTQGKKAKRKVLHCAPLFIYEIVYLFSPLYFDNKFILPARICICDHHTAASSPFPPLLPPLHTP